MENNKKIGVFLCQCDGRIDPWIDLAWLKKELEGDPAIAQMEILPLSCSLPGLTRIKTLIQEKGLDRILIAGCETRILLKKFYRELEEAGILEGQIDMVNLRDHVAAVHNLQPQEMAAKGAKLIGAAVAGLATLEPTVSEKVDFVGPIMLLGGGIATYPAAQELLRKNIDCILAVQTEEYEDEIRMLHEHYPGERHYYDRLRKIMKEVDESPLVRRITVGELQTVRGRTGHYTVTFSTL
jgi:heterodisulfide reductase subunit A2